MAAIMKFLCVAILFSLIMGGDCQHCTKNNLKISQAATGKLVQNKPEWNVTITNNCICSQLGVKISCDGFQTLEKIESSILSKSGSECLVNGGQPIYGNRDFSFTYAWGNSFPFKTLSSQVACS
ncbi:hypothetical protein M0R45_011453 [Rubus argutus]|uniref:Uncharacterized protein n=1 Tax=Rubus argutus TaxID=59490 RepID=A0AAW1YA27_RUBAR